MQQDGAFGMSFPARRTSLDAKPEETAAAKYLKFDLPFVEQSFFHLP